MPWYILFFATSNHKVSYVLKTIEITERNIKKKIPRFFRPLILYFRLLCPPTLLDRFPQDTQDPETINSQAFRLGSFAV